MSKPKKLDYVAGAEYEEDTEQRVINTMTNYERIRWSRAGYPGRGNGPAPVRVWLDSFRETL